MSAQSLTNKTNLPLNNNFNNLEWTRSPVGSTNTVDVDSYLAILALPGAGF